VGFLESSWDEIWFGLKKEGEKKKKKVSLVVSGHIRMKLLQPFSRPFPVRAAFSSFLCIFNNKEEHVSTSDANVNTAASE
jgi:hypothetical protein